MKSSYNKEVDIFRSFDDTEAFKNYLLKEVPIHLRENTYDPFYGVSFDNALVKIIEGDLSLLGRAQSIIGDLQEQNIFSSGVPLLKSAVCGFVPNVPAAIQNHPEAFFTRVRDEAQSMNAPLSIYVETSISAGVSNYEIVNRGIAVLAFVLAMQNIRPVDLYVVYAAGECLNTGIAVRIESRPLNLSVATWALTNFSFPRRLGFHSIKAVTKKHNRDIPWAWGLAGHSKDYEASIRDAFGLKPDDVYIPGGHLYDTLMLKDPIAWVKQMLERHNKIMEEELA